MSLWVCVAVRFDWHWLGDRSDVSWCTEIRDITFSSKAATHVKPVTKLIQWNVATCFAGLWQTCSKANVIVFVFYKSTNSHLHKDAAVSILRSQVKNIVIFDFVASRTFHEVLLRRCQNIQIYIMCCVIDQKFGKFCLHLYKMTIFSVYHFKTWVNLFPKLFQLLQDQA